MLALTSQVALANNVVIENVRLVHQQGDEWQVAVTLLHHDTGWDHYADGWRVMDVAGRVLGYRTLYHPHVHEQPFTRSLTMSIPPSVKHVFVEAHDKVHGWSPQRVTVDLSKAKGEHFEVVR